MEQNDQRLDTDNADTRTDITVYWRPGCMFCSHLLRKLEKSGIEHSLVNIWEDDDAAATVREHANGNETVPTVRVGDRWFVNPSFRTLRRAYEELAG